MSIWLLANNNLWFYRGVFYALIVFYMCGIRNIIYLYFTCLIFTKIFLEYILRSLCWKIKCWYCSLVYILLFSDAWDGHLRIIRQDRALRLLWTCIELKHWFHSPEMLNCNCIVFLFIHYYCIFIAVGTWISNISSFTELTNTDMCLQILKADTSGSSVKTWC